MALALWPASLPAPIADPSAMLGGPNNVQESAMDAGPPKLRRTSTLAIRDANCTLKLNQAQLATLRTFYYTTLHQVDPFQWTDFTTGDTATFQFTKDGYQESYIQGQVDRWQVKLNLRKLT